MKRTGEGNVSRSLRLVTNLWGILMSKSSISPDKVASLCDVVFLTINPSSSPDIRLWKSIQYSQSVPAKGVVRPGGKLCQEESTPAESITLSSTFLYQQPAFDPRRTKEDRKELLESPPRDKRTKNSLGPGSRPYPSFAPNCKS